MVGVPRPAEAVSASFLAPINALPMIDPTSFFNTTGETTDAPRPLRVLQPFTVGASDAELLTVGYDVDQVRLVARQPGKVVVKAFPLRRDAAVDLELEPFHVAGPRTRVVIGHKGQPDEPLNFDPTAIAFFRGQVSGRAGSHVFLAFSDRLSTGSIDFGPGAGRYWISTKDRYGRPLPSGQLSVFEAHGAGGLPTGVPLCGVEGDRPFLPDEVRAAAPEQDGTVAGPLPRVGLQHLELAIETDYEYFSLFGNSIDASTYVFLMYGAMSDIYMRDVDTRIQVVFVRIWTDPNDIVNGPDPLSEFYSEWTATMGGVARDNAQFFSGRRDFPYGGAAYLSSICASFGYGVAGYALGFFPDPSKPSPYSWDIDVTAHEFGHSCGAHHTHDLGWILARTPPRRPGAARSCPTAARPGAA